MRIALVIYQFHESRGGAERACFYLARGLVEHGFDVHVFSHKFKELGTVKLIHHYVPVGGLFSVSRHVSFARNVSKMLKMEKFDIIHSFSRTYYQDVLRVGGGIHREYLRRMPNGQLLKLFLFLRPRECAILRLEKKCFKHGAYKKIVAVSKKCKQEILQNYDVNPENIEVIYNGIDIERFHPQNKNYYNLKIRRMFGISEKTFILLFVGSGFRRKGLHNAIESLAFLPKGIDLKLLVIGRGDVAHNRALARKHRVHEKVMFLGPRDNIHEFYSAADALVLPTYYDPFPNVCLEALASGVPVITSRQAGISEVLSDSKDSFILENPEKVVELAERIRALYEPDVRKTFCIRARETAEKFSIEKNTEQNIKLYYQILQKQ